MINDVNVAVIVLRCGWHRRSHNRGAIILVVLLLLLLRLFVIGLLFLLL